MLGVFERSLRGGDSSHKSSGAGSSASTAVTPSARARAVGSLLRPAGVSQDPRCYGAVNSPTPSQTSTRSGSVVSERPLCQYAVSCVSNRLYTSATLASAAKTRACSSCESPVKKENLEELASRVIKTLDFQEGKRVSQLITLDISDDAQRSHGGVVRRRRSLPNISHDLGINRLQNPSLACRRSTAHAIPSFSCQNSSSAADVERRHTCSKADGYTRRLGSDGSSGSSSPTRTDSPSPPASPMPNSTVACRQFRRFCAVHDRPVRDKTPPRFELTLRSNDDKIVEEGYAGKSRNLSLGPAVKQPICKSSSSDCCLGRSIRSSYLSRSNSDSRAVEMVKESRGRLNLSNFLVELNPTNVRKSTIYFPARNLRKLNGKSFMDLSRILEEHHYDGIDGVRVSEHHATASITSDVDSGASADVSGDDGRWLRTEQMWLVHKDGFSAVQLLTPSISSSSSTTSSLSCAAAAAAAAAAGRGDGRVCVRLDCSDEVLHVDEDDVEKANPAQLDYVEQLSLLRHINESSVLHTLRQRYGRRAVHTAAGPLITLVLHPLRPLPAILYSPQVMRMFRSSQHTHQLPPHVFAVGRRAYRALLSERRDQAVVVLGRSGAGKSTACRHLLRYWTTTTAAAAASLTAERLEAVWTLLESFCNCRTVMNVNASRCTCVFTLHFDHAGAVTSGSVQVLLLERDRVVRRPEGEPNFNIFYQLLAGADDSLRHKLLLDDAGTEANSFMTPLQRYEEIQSAAVAWSRVLSAAAVVHITPVECHVLWSVLAAVVHLGAAGVCTDSAGRCQFANVSAAGRAATLLGVRVEQLARAVFATCATNAAAASPVSPNGARDECVDARGALEAFVAGLYAQLVAALVSLINRCIEPAGSGGSSTSSTASSSAMSSRRRIVLVDAAGVQNAASCGRPTGATLDELCLNYGHERLQLLCQQRVVVCQRRRYVQENIELNLTELDCDLSTPAPLVAALDQPPVTAPPQTVQSDASNSLSHATSSGRGERQGLFWLLEDAASRRPVLTDSQFVQALAGAFNARGDDRLVSVSEGGGGSGGVRVHHCQGTSPVTYDTSGWVAAVRRDCIAGRRAAVLLQESHREPVSRLFVAARAALSSSASSSSCALSLSSLASDRVDTDSGSGGGLSLSSLRRASSVRRMLASPAMSAGGVGVRASRVILAKLQMDGLLERVAGCSCRFVHCLLPQHNAGIVQLKSPPSHSSSSLSSSPSSPPAASSSISTLLSSSTSTAGAMKPADISINVPLLRSQLRGAQILDAVRLHKHGYPHHMPFAEFVRRFSLLTTGTPSGVNRGKHSGDGSSDARQQLEQLLAQLELDPLCYRLGLTQIFFRSGGLVQLEERCSERVHGSIVRLQACCRGLLARNCFHKLKVQDVAIRCVQRNVRKHMAIDEWSWWRLMVKVKPLLDVHRTEHQLSATMDELTKLKARLEKVEQEKTDLEHENSRLQAKVSELTTDLCEENHTATLAGDQLAAEQADRLQLQTQLQSVQGELSRVCSLNERLRGELLDCAATNGTVDQSGDNGGDSFPSPAACPAASSAPDSSAGDGDGETATVAAGLRRQYEFVVRELQFARQTHEQQLDDKQQHLDTVTRQLEKKADNARDEAEQQRCIVAQLRKKVARLNSELCDQKVHVDQQTARCNMLDKQQRRFDAEMNVLHESVKQERQTAERVGRERDQLQAEVYSLQNEMAAMKLELSMSDEKSTALRRELDELTAAAGGGGGGGVDGELTSVRRARLELQRRCSDQDDEIDDLAGQVALLEQAKLRLEMALEQARKEHRLEMVQKDDETDELRASVNKKVKALESQLESEHDERTALLRDKHELERRIIALSAGGSCASCGGGGGEGADTPGQLQACVQRLRRELKQCRALLRDTQLQLEQARADNGSKVQLRQLRHQLEDAEFAAASAARARQTSETELADSQEQLQLAQRARADAETRNVSAGHQLHQLQTQLDEQEHELQEVMRKYKISVSQLSADQLTISDQNSQMASLEAERGQLKEQLNELSSRLQQLSVDGGSREQQLRLELRERELHSRLDYEAAARHRLESQLARVKEALERATHEADSRRHAQQTASDQLSRLQRQFREIKEQLAECTRRESDAVNQTRALSKQLEQSETETAQHRADLRLALKRIADLQNAIQGEIESGDDVSDALSDDTDDDDDDEEDDGVDVFLSARMTSSSRDSAASVEGATRHSTAFNSVGTGCEAVATSPTHKTDSRLLHGKCFSAAATMNGSRAESEA